MAIAPINTFSECLGTFMKEHRISISELTRRLNYRSNTTLSRILRDQSSYETAHSCFDDILERGGLDIPGESLRKLNAALEVNRLGKSRALTYDALWELLCGPEEDSLPISIDLGDATTENTTQFKNLVDKIYLRSKSLDFTIINCCYRALTDQLSDMLRALPPETKCSVSHFLTLGSAPEYLAQMACALRPVFYDQRYNAYSLSEDPGAELASRGIARDILLCRGVDLHGRSFTHLMSMFSEHSAALYSADADGGLYRYIRRVVTRFTQNYQSIKTDNTDNNIVSLVARCTAREEDRTMYVVRQDIAYNHIDWRILYQAVERGGFFGLNRDHALIRDLTEQHKSRLTTATEKRKHTHIILDTESMRRFGRTGRKADQLLGLAPFTREERLEIFEGFRKMCAESEFIHLHFPKPDLVLNHIHMTLYEGAAVHFYYPYTNYRSRDLRGETRIVNKPFLDMLHDFYMDELVGRGMLDENESLRLLDELTEEIRAQE